MKKFIYPFCILAMCAGAFSSCDKDDDEENNNGSNENVTQPQKQVATMAYDKGPSFTFEFDSNGRIKSLIGANIFGGPSKEEYDYSNLVVTGKYGSESIDGTLNADGTLASVLSKSQTMKYTYDNKQLVHFTHTQIIDESNSSDLILTYTWENGNIVSTEVISGGQSNGTSMELDVKKLQFKYTNDKYATPIENKGGLMLSFYHNSSFYAFVNGTGVACKNLPVSINWGTGTFDDIEYDLDENGYPVKISFKDQYITYTWK